MDQIDLKRAKARLAYPGRSYALREVGAEFMGRRSPARVHFYQCVSRAFLGLNGHRVNASAHSSDLLETTKTSGKDPIE